MLLLSCVWDQRRAFPIWHAWHTGSGHFSTDLSTCTMLSHVYELRHFMLIWLKWSWRMSLTRWLGDRLPCMVRSKFVGVVMVNSPYGAVSTEIIGSIGNPVCLWYPIVMVVSFIVSTLCSLMELKPSCSPEVFAAIFLGQSNRYRQEGTYKTCGSDTDCMLWSSAWKL